MRYRGKYPHRITAIASSSRGLLCVTNNGNRYIVRPINDWGRAHMPRLGDEIEALAQTNAYAMERE